MGNDGGSIPDRTSQIRVRKRKRRINKAEIQKTKSNVCSMTKEQLRKPIVGDRLGQLYNLPSLIDIFNKLLGINISAGSSQYKQSLVTFIESRFIIPSELSITSNESIFIPKAKSPV